MTLRDSLKPREIEVLRLITDGLSNREISENLFISVETVKWYNKQIYSKLDVSGRKEAAQKAQQLSLLDDSTQPDIAVDTAKNNLPQETTPFIGRTHDIHAIQTLLQDAENRLVTILAPGGMGKTRLSMKVARSQIGRYADGIFFIALAPLSSPNDIVTTIAENIGFVFHGEQTLTQQLANFLKDRTMLLIMDNFEHLLEGASLVSDIVKSTQNINIVITSRERLNLHGENVYSLRGLEFPEWETPADALEYDAVKLFMSSAQRARTDFDLHDNDLDYLSRICKLTAGMPLGIELAAGWVDALSLEQIANEIQQGIDILETDMRDVPERHRSLRATFERTWNRLTDDEQAIFSRLSVFRGGFTLPAAQAVAGANARHLRKLAQKALVQNENNDRYAIHELLRQYGESKLLETPEPAAIQAKHAIYFTDFIANCKDDLKASGQLDALERIDAEFENVRLAWIYVVDHHQWDQLPKFLYSLWFYCDIRSRSQEVINLFEYAMQTLQSMKPSSETQLALGRIMAWIGWFYQDLGFRPRAIDICEEAIRILKPYDSKEDLLIACQTILLVSEIGQDVENVSSLEQFSYQLAQELGDRNWQARNLIFEDLRHDPNALYKIKQAQSIFEELGDQQGQRMCSLSEARLMFRQGEVQIAEELVRRAERLVAPFKSAWHHAESYRCLGLIAVYQNNYEHARYYLYQSLQLLWDAGYSQFATGILVRIAQVLYFEGQLERAVEIVSLLHNVPATHRDIYNGMDRGWNMPVQYDDLCIELEDSLSPDQFTMVWSRGQELDLSKLVADLLSEMK
jgi:predicted ATPase/DNA-binding CsgD family transcriptional regulator